MSDKNGLPSGKHTLVEEGTEFKGTMSSNCPIVVMGKVEGDVTGPMIQVTASGVIAGNVKVKELRSAGEVAGEVQAEAVTISGRVRDKTVIRARTLQVTLNTGTGKGMEVMFGECELAIGDEPDKAAAITAATAPPPETKPEPIGAKADEDEKEKGGKEGKRSRSGTAPPPT